MRRWTAPWAQHDSWAPQLSLPFSRSKVHNWSINIAPHGKEMKTVVMGEWREGRRRGWGPWRAVWGGRWEGWRSSSATIQLLKAWKLLFLQAQISCPYPPQESHHIFLPTILSLGLGFPPLFTVPALPLHIVPKLCQVMTPSSPLT